MNESPANDNGSGVMDMAEWNSGDRTIFTNIDMKVMAARRTEGWVTLFIYTVIVIVLWWLTLRYEWYFWFVGAAMLWTLASIPLELIWLPRLKYSTWKYSINEYEVELWHGMIRRKRTLIPMVRIQHVDAKQGPILRRYGLFTVTFSTAAGSHEIPALTEETAEAVRRKIAELARIGDEDV